MRKLWFLLLIAAGVSAQTINPNSQITWPRVSGSGAPTGHIACPATVNNPTNATVGTPYTDTTGPHYWVCTAGGWFQVDGAGGNITDFKHNGALLTGQFAVNPQIYDYDETAISPTAGFVTGTFHADTATGKWNVQVPVSQTSIAPLVQAPAAGQYVILYPHRYRTTAAAAGSISGFADGTNGSGMIKMGNICSLSYTNEGTWDQYSLADYGIDPGQVTQVYGFAIAGISAQNTDNFCYPTLADPNWASTSMVTGGASLSLPANQPVTTQQTTALTVITGTGIATASTVGTMIITGATSLNTIYNIDSVGLIVYYTGTPVTVPNRLYVKAPINYDAGTPAIYLDPAFPQLLNGVPYTAAPDPNANYGKGIILTGTTNCRTTSGNPYDSQWCKVIQPTPGTPLSAVWSPFSSGGGTSGTYFTETVTCTTTCTLAHTPLTFINFVRNGLVQYNVSDFTQSGVTVTLVDPAVGGDSFYAQYYY